MPHAEARPKRSTATPKQPVAAANQDHGQPAARKRQRSGSWPNIWAIRSESAINAQRVGGTARLTVILQRDGFDVGGRLVLANSIWHSAFQMPQIAIVMGCLVPIAGFICLAWYKIHKVRSDNELKHALVQRGMSAEEIERVISAGQPEELL
jgi:hypothetical protein